MKDNNSWRLSVIVAACIFIMLVCVFSLWKAALPHNESATIDEGISVVATVYPLYVSLLNIAQGTTARPHLLTLASAGCAHDLSLTASDMKSLQEADLVVACGEGMEGFLDKLRSIKGEALVAVCEGWSGLDEGNPHIWMSTDGAAWQALRIAEALSQVDSANSHLYMANCDEYTSRIASLGSRLDDALSAYRGRKVVLLHEAFVYLVREAGFDVAFVLSEAELSSPVAKRINEVSSLIRQARGAGEEIVCVADAMPSATVQLIQDEAAARVLHLSTCTTGDLVPSSYISAMDDNISLLAAAFAGSR